MSLSKFEPYLESSSKDESLTLSDDDEVLSEVLARANARADQAARAKPSKLTIFKNDLMDVAITVGYPILIMLTLLPVLCLFIFVYGLLMFTAVNSVCGALGGC